MAVVATAVATAYIAALIVVVPAVASGTGIWTVQQARDQAEQGSRGLVQLGRDLRRHTAEQDH